jgi:hypothetical protein
MPKPNHKQKLLDAGLAPFIATAIMQPSVQEIVLSGGVPKGSFREQRRARPGGPPQ